ncbi:hypothetical protein [Paracoccus sp. SM22M-07]|uniref:hypothetical protein n=1 Tax=Paracoccus sp. SM22M-07 TaxID=1520813 RepID=UPI000916F39B|nr:hypothetical protein [Paracoccus sp. SM22M-07]OJH45156.1 hypothetical protein IE00_05670 [Paracoccus sp. SM22M-07]
MTEKLTDEALARQIIPELMMIGCHENGEARCTCGIGADAAQLIERLLSRRATPADDLLATMDELIKQARKTHRIGAQTGPHWLHLGIAISKADHALIAALAQKDAIHD